MRADLCELPTRRRAEDCPPYLGVYAMPDVRLRCMHGSPRPQKAASHNSAMGDRGQLVLYHHQPRASGQKPTVPCRHRRCCARCHEVQSREIRLALPLCLLMPDHLHAVIAFPREAGMAMIVKNWKKFLAGEHAVSWQRDFFDHRLRDHHEVEEKPTTS